MEIIALILIIVFVSLSGTKKGKRARGAARNPNLAQGLQSSKLAQAVQAARAADAEKAQKAAQAAKQARAAAQAKSAAGPGKPAAEAKLKNLRFVPLAVPAEGQAMLADEDCLGGSMAHAHDEGASALEDEDCFGGSMEHTHTEGVSRTEQARRMTAIDESRTVDVLPERIDARALRRAVVMAEVLGRPRALRGRQ